MVVLVVIPGLLGTRDDVEGSPRANGEPGVFAVVERLGYAVEADDISVKSRAFRQVHHINGHMVDTGGGGLGLQSDGEDKGNEGGR